METKARCNRNYSLQQQYNMLVEGRMPLPWWEFSSADFAPPGSVAQPDSDVDEALLRGFLRAGALAETAARFLSGMIQTDVPGIIPGVCHRTVVRQYS